MSYSIETFQTFGRAPDSTDTAAPKATWAAVIRDNATGKTIAQSGLCTTEAKAEADASAKFQAWQKKQGR